MNRLSSGFPLLEGNDFASAAALRDLAMTADEKLFAQESELDFLERPEAVVGRMSMNQTITAGVTSSAVNFDTTHKISRWGADVFGGIWLNGGLWRPGIYLVGAFLYGTTAGAVNSFWFDLQSNDKRGPKYLGTVTEQIRDDDCSGTFMTLSSNNLYEINDASNYRLAVNANMTGAGSVALQSSSCRIWMLRVRGLSDV